MKIFLLLTSILALFAMGGCVRVNNAEQVTKVDDIYQADNARLELEQKGDVCSLMVALKTETRPRIREGIIYSLGRLKAPESRNIIEKMAFEQMDKSPASVLALACYDDSFDAINKLAIMGSQVAKSALQMKYQKMVCCAKAKLCCNEIGFLRNMGNCNGNKKFLLKTNPKSEAEASAVCYALARIGGKDCAYKIVSIMKKHPTISEQPLAICANSTDVILSEVKAKNVLAVKAVKLAKVSEAENILLEQLSSADENYKALLLSSLEVVGAEKTANKIVDSFKSLSVKELGIYVKIANFSLSRCNENQKQKLYAKLKYYTSENSVYAKAAQRIISGK
ncbi:MAG: hypothetical protein J6B07_05985 [Opitutales bacterium]|nr:hypothetical protein [Opitutales bacterium]